MSITSIVKFISVFVAIWFTTVNILRTARGMDVPTANFIWMALSITTFLFIQFNLW